ncbi:MAG: hypothetical protein ACE5HE_15090 [Phycisphaerae bacterium]
MPSDRRTTKAVSLALAGGFLLAGIGTTCTSFTGTAALDAVDFCFIFDCQNALGGIVDPCVQFQTVNTTTGQVTGPPQGMLVDCP